MAFFWSILGFFYAFLAFPLWVIASEGSTGLAKDPSYQTAIIAVPQLSPHMKFKVGFEFQENNGLCPWALNNDLIQKKPLFELGYKETNKPLWEVVIDTNDIEFVTEPFTYQQRLNLQRCIRTINQCLDILTEFARKQQPITFESWTDQIETLLESSPYALRYFGKYTAVRDARIRPPSKWKPAFSPQATIQHPLEHAIPLYFGLFGFASEDMIPFSQSLPWRDPFLDSQKAANFDTFSNFIFGYQNKITGLVFLHALTLVQIAPQEDQDDSALLKETQKCLKERSQVDAKLKLTLMSRRPFSSMFKDIKPSLQVNNYRTYFLLSMGYNSSFSRSTPLFKKINYAEQFFDSNTGQPKSLVKFLSCFKEDFLNKNQSVLTNLLAQGVVSTTMIRNFRENIKIDNSIPPSQLFNDFFNQILKSVEFPARNCIINPEAFTLLSVPWGYDILSPPCFLDTENSMGRFREDLTEEDKQYGEAIIEVRGIRSVGPWFLNHCKLGPNLKENFLTEPGNDLESQALCLFDFLHSFGSSKDITEIFWLGMPYALRKY